MTEIRNTTADMQDSANAAAFLLDQLASPRPGDPTDAIERMEAAGQAQLVNSDRLPTKTQDEGDDAQYLALGFTFGDPDRGDPMFRTATLPPGWSRKATDHSMWSRLVDEHGRERVSIFYKAAFYDRSAHMHINTHYGYLSTVLYENGTPVLDDVWLPLDVCLAQLERIAVSLDKQAAEADDYARRDTRSDTDYWTTRADEHRAEAAKARALAGSLVTS
jgi:hypothetical protein